MKKRILVLKTWALDNSKMIKFHQSSHSFFLLSKNINNTQLGIRCAQVSKIKMEHP